MKTEDTLKRFEIIKERALKAYSILQPEHTLNVRYEKGYVYFKPSYEPFAVSELKMRIGKFDSLVCQMELNSRKVNN